MQALEELSSKAVRRAPIVDDSGKACGIISLDDLLVLLTSELQKISDIIQKQIHA